MLILNSCSVQMKLYHPQWNCKMKEAVILQAVRISCRNDTGRVWGFSVLCILLLPRTSGR